MTSTVPTEETLVPEKATPVEEVPQWQLPNLQRVEDMQISQAGGRADQGSRVQKVRKVKRKDESLLGTLRAAIVQHQLGLSINCLLLLALTHAFFPRLRPTTSQFFSFAYYNPETGLYNPGVDDLKLVCFWIIVFCGLRAGTMDYILMPWARLLGIRKKKEVDRFAEQAWLLIYYLVFWPVGLYLIYQSPYWLNLSAMWENFPAPAMTGLFKWYYLAQFAFWIQQILVVHIEEKRKDHWQMFTHHIITCALMFGSYGNYQTKVGNVFLCLMDIVDLFLPLAKMLKYAGYQTACDLAFGVFILTWFMARHVSYLIVCWSVYADIPVVMGFGCANAVTGERLATDSSTITSNLLHAYAGDPEAPVCFNYNLRAFFLALLLALQAITIAWFGLIVRVAWNVLSGKNADDVRSDDEGDEDEEEEDMEENDRTHDDVEKIQDFANKTGPTAAAKTTPLLSQPREEEVGVEDLKFVRRPSQKKHQHQQQQQQARWSKGRASGISIPGHGDHKELLGRIGCDKPN